MTTNNLPSWKRIPKISGDIYKDEAKECMNSIILEAESKETKEVLLKIKIDQSYEVNMKVLMSLDVKLIHQTGKYLDINSDNFTKDGMVYMIMKKLFSLMPNKCDKIVRNTSEAREIRCVGCNTSLCANCKNGKSCVCKSCHVWIKERYNPPEEYF